jgi:hypothetical protein
VGPGRRVLQSAVMGRERRGGWGDVTGGVLVRAGSVGPVPFPSFPEEKLRVGEGYM